MPVESNCINCGDRFYCYPSELEKGRKYCSASCRSLHLHKKAPSAESRTPINFICKECEKPFVMMKSYLRAYEKKFGRGPIYCSMDCSKTGRRKSADERNKFTCQHCGKVQIRSRNTPNFRIYRDQKYCSNECKSRSQEVSAFQRFEAGDFGRHVKKNGYVWISVPALANGGKKTMIMEHRYVMQKLLGRTLRQEETVHHINGKRGDNRPDNLELFSSRHGPGQRMVDKVAFAIEILRLYPEFARQAGVELRDLVQT